MTATRRDVLKFGGAVVAGMLFPRLTASAQATGGAKPNIVFVFSDDHATQAIGAYNGRLSAFCRQHDATPNIDRLATEGALFTSSFCCNSLCSPSRAAVLTGLHSHANGVQSLNKPIRRGAWTFPGALSAAGYQTALIGKWHLGGNPGNHGVDYWRITPGQGGSYWASEWVGPDGKQRLPGYISEVTTDLSLKWLDQRDKSKPFMLMVHHKAPHRPWLPPSRHYRWLEDVDVPEPDTLFDDYTGRASPAAAQTMRIDRDMKMDHDLKVLPRGQTPGQMADATPEQKAEWDAVFGPRNDAFRAANPQGRDLARWKYQQYIKDYLRCVKGVDDSVGAILDYLDRNKLADNTIVIYCSDQGFYTGEHGWFDKRWIYEESLQMPFIIRWPGVVAAGSRPGAMIQNIDYAATFVDIAGGQIPDTVHGRSFLPILHGRMPADWRKSVYYHFSHNATDHSVARHEGVRTDRFTLAHFYDSDEWELYDLKTDPQQLRSVAADPAYADTLAELKAELQRLKRQYQVPERT